MSSSSEEDHDETEERTCGKSDREDLAKFLNKLQPKMLNLMNEFADAEMFLIDGDSLVMELALDKNLDWTYSGQLLHLVYLFERYLHLFVRKDGVFQIVFFRDFDEVWKSRPCIYLARKVIIQHLLANVSRYKVLCQFESPWDPDFVKYIKYFVPSFMLLSDGEILSENRDQELIPEHVLRTFVLHLLKVLSLEMNCAFTYGVEFGTSTLNGFHIAYSPRFRNWKVPMPEPVQILNLDAFSASSDVPCLPKIIDCVFIKLNSNSSKFDKACKDENGIIDCRLILHVVTVSVYLKLFLTSENQDFQHDLVRILLLHGVFLTELPLKYRAFSMNVSDLDTHDQVKESLGRLQYIMAKVLDVYLEALKDEESQWSMSGICDAWDGRLFFQILIFLLENQSDGSEIPLSDSSKRKFESVLYVVSSLLDGEDKFEGSSILPHVRISEIKYSLQKKENRTEAVVKEKDGIIQVECSLLNEYAGKILENTSVKKLDINDPDVAALVVSGNNFDERYHWHSGKPLGDEYDRTNENNSDVKDKRALKKSQDKLARYMQRYGQSLQGEVNYKPIIVEKDSKTRKKDKKKVSKKSLEIQKENSMKMEKMKLQKEEDLWRNKKKEVEQYENEGKYGAAIDLVNRSLKTMEGKTGNAMLLTKARLLWKNWKDYCTENKGGRDETDAEMLFLTIQELLESDKGGLTKKDKDTLAEYLDGLGFGDIVLKTSLTEKSFKSNDEYKLKISSARFQLHNIGDKLKRETRTDPDYRVEHFIPETWQRELLNAVDNKQSALIVAPTSSGKTFASYYCMEQVLKEDDEGVVVYVSPTKALVNQVAATCCVRYKKEMPPGKSVYGVFTRDYRQNALTCQILVTVPQCLEILLLSPARQDWVARIRYVVFDEVHCIGSEIGAEVWEHLLLMIRCPFLALSATIRNPDDLHQWLQSAEDEKFHRDTINDTLRPNSPKSYQVALVMYNERYNDLEKFNYLPAKKEESIPKIEHIHPCSVVTTRQLKQSGTFPAHVSLSPRETLAFYDAIQTSFNDDESLLRLSPESYFKDAIFITKQNVRSYESALKESFMTYVKNNDKRVNKVFDNLPSNRTINWSFPKHRMKDFLTFQIFPFVEELKRTDQLPVIFFSFDRGLCEEFADELIFCLEEKEKKCGVREKGEDKFEQKMAKAEKRHRDEEVQAEATRKTESAGHDSFHQKKKTTAEASCFLVNDPPPDSCSFAGKGVLDAAGAQIIVERLTRWGEKSSDSEERFKEGLRRGVSYHHAGMSSKKRGAVEMLFRKKFVRVVFATSTLALGIHMPCKTVVFAKDSVFLNTLQYHQISGRAGRRGYDKIGNVIFFGIPAAKIQRLMTVSLPRIIGNFPLNVSLVLRLLLLVNNVGNREIAMNQVLTLLQNPLICKNQPELDLQLKHHFLFSVELLVRQGLIDEKGNPQGLAGLATHLHYHEPSNFVLVTFLRDGLLHDFCRNARSYDGRFSKDFLKSLLILLSHLFARRKLHKMLLRRKRSTSKVVLEKLPANFMDGLVDYNNKVHDVFDLYLRTVAAHVYDTLGEDVTLPLSSCELISSENYHVNSPAVTLDDKLHSVAQSYKACSAFAALSGHTDNRLYDSQDLISNIRYQVYTDVKVVPTLEVDVDLNAYAYDFFNHGNCTALTQENGLMEGDAFHLVKDFMLVLKSISVSLTEVGPEDLDDDVVAAFTQLTEEFETVFNNSFNR